ncbi:hypothetical protein [Sphaerisporangium dianthi]|uniref:Uncharacterized protein n=1 Tax=Sphaerisporangium dianthi TaxID=1436120 RepID=A0ABV9C9I7_9ACTN
MVTASFSGLASWPDDQPRVEFSTPRGILDLHNNAKIERVDFAPGSAVLSIAFRYAENWREVDTKGRPVVLEFRGVRHLRMQQAADYDPRAADSLEGVVHRTENGVSRFEVDMGDITCSLLAEALVLHDDAAGTG